MGNYLVLQYLRSTVYDIVQKYMDMEKSKEDSANQVRQSHLRQKTARIPPPAIIQRAHFEDPGILLCKLSTPLGVNEVTMRQLLKVTETHILCAQGTTNAQ